MPPLATGALVRAISRVTLGDLGRTGIPGQARLPDPAARGSAALERWAVGTGGAAGRFPGRYGVPNRADLDELRELEKTADAFRRWGHQYGGGMRRKAVVGQLNEMADLLAEYHPRPVAADTGVRGEGPGHDSGAVRRRRSREGRSPCDGRSTGGGPFTKARG